MHDIEIKYLTPKKVKKLAAVINKLAEIVEKRKYLNEMADISIKHHSHYIDKEVFKIIIKNSEEIKIDVYDTHVEIRSEGCDE